MSRRGAMVALSGVDSAGKSTQRDMLIETLRGWGLSPVCVWSRAGYTPGLKRLRRLARLVTGRRKPQREGVSDAPSRYPRRASNLKGPLKRRLWLAAALLDLIWLYGVRVRLMRARGRVVICDRYLLDCVVDFRVNFPLDRVERGLLFRLLRRVAPVPDAAFCLLVPAEVSWRRSREKTRYHWETREVLQARHAAYDAASGELGVRVIDGERPADGIAASIRAAVEDALPRVPAPQRRSA